MNTETRSQFLTSSGLVRWFLGPAQLAFGGRRAIDYDRDGGGGGRDPYALDRLHALFALAGRCLPSRGTRERTILDLAFGAPDDSTQDKAEVARRRESPRRDLAAPRGRNGFSDGQIARMLATSETTIRRERNAALRDVETKARELESHAVERIGVSLLPVAVTVQSREAAAMADARCEGVTMLFAGWMTVSEVAERLGVSRQRVYQLRDERGWPTGRNDETRVVISPCCVESEAEEMVCETHGMAVA